MCIVILPGQYYDEETGLHYNYFRYYDTKSGRYLRADPLRLTAGVNLYSYVFNNPANLLDPLGLFVHMSLDNSTHTLTATDIDTGKTITMRAFSGGKSSPDGISCCESYEIPIPSGGYFIIDNPNPNSSSDWFGLVRIDKRIDDYDENGRSGFRLHFGELGSKLEI